MAIHRFRLPIASLATLQQRGFEYRPILPFVDVEVLHYPWMTPDDPKFNWGSITQHELYFRLFVGKYEYRAGISVATEAAVFIPYIFVDNAWSVISGREVVGFPKVMATFRLATGQGQQTQPVYPITVCTDAFAQYSPQTTQTACPIVEIESNQAGPGTEDLPSGVIWPWGIYDTTKVDPVLLPFLQDRTKFSTIQLKQMRDAETTSLACYQALIHAEFQIGRLGPLKALPAAEMSVPHYDSLGISEELGLGSGLLQPLWQYTVSCDLKFGNIQTLFLNT